MIVTAELPQLRNAVAERRRILRAWTDARDCSRRSCTFVVRGPGVIDPISSRRLHGRPDASMTMGEFVYSGELHPFHRRARIVRALRAFSNIRGWERLSALLVPKAAAGPFRVRNQSGLFAGELSSFIDRSMYLRGGYEENHIRAFLSRVPAERRGLVLDVGANVGTHSLGFSRHLKAVHAHRD